MSAELPEVRPCPVCESCEVHRVAYVTLVKCECMPEPGSWMTLERWNVRLEVMARTVVVNVPGHVWVRAVAYHDEKDQNTSYDDDEYVHPFTVEVFTEDPGEYSHDGGTPAQFRVRVEVK